jgi:hypothetical protein
VLYTYLCHVNYFQEPFTMKTSLLKSVAFLGLTATFFAITEAWAAGHPNRLIDQDKVESTLPTLDTWVMSQLDYPSLVEGEYENIPVVLRLRIGANGLVEVWSCAASMAVLEPYVRDRLQGKRALVRNEYLNRDFEMKINFRSKEDGH